MTNEDFYALRQHLINLLEEKGFRDVKVDMTLGAYQPGGSLHLELSASAMLAPEEFSISKPQREINNE